MLGSRLLFGALALGTSLVALAGCDSAPGPRPLDARPPVVSDLAFSPDSVYFDDIVGADDLAAFDLALSVDAADPDGGAIDRVAYVVQGQFEGTIASGALEDDGGGRYAATVPLQLGRGQRGRYTVLVYAVDDDGLLSNEVRGLFELTGLGLGPPVIDAIDAPSEFQQPGTLQLIAAVSDPDGLEDVARVEVAFPAPFSSTFQLFDDGTTAGDETADDGRYTATFEGVQLPPEFEVPYELDLTFRAFDRDGFASDDVLFTLTIVE
jgi:hypothetical protein